MLKNNKITWPAASWFQMFLAFGNLMNPPHSFLKYYYSKKQDHSLQHLFSISCGMVLHCPHLYHSGTGSEEFSIDEVG